STPHDVRGGRGRPGPRGRGLAGARSGESAAGHPGRPRDRRHGDGDRGDERQSPGAPAADGARPSHAHVRAQDLQRPRAGGRPCGQYRPVSGAAEPDPADRARARDRRDGPAPPRDAVRRARGLHPGRRRGRTGDLSPRRQGGRPARVRVPDPPYAHDGGPPHDRRRDGVVPGEPEPGAGGRPCDQHRRGRRLPCRGQVHQAPRRRSGRGGAVDRRIRGEPPPMTAGPLAATGPAPPPAEPRERLAALDVGSNSIRLLVAEYDPHAGLSIIDEVKDQPRLAQGLAPTARLAEAAMERALAPLARMREVCRRRGVRRIAAVATAAVREAANGEEVVRRVREELDLPLRVIDAGTEATLSYRSVAHHFRVLGARTLVADIGGGSLELIGAVDGLVELTLSLPLGAVRLTEMHLVGKRDPRREVASLRTQVRKQLKKAFRPREWTAATLIGSGGTFTSLGRMATARRGLPLPETVHGVSVATAEVETLLEWLSAKTPEQRRLVAGLNPQRADIILAGLAVTAELLALVDARTVTVSAFGLREGLLLEMVGGEAAPAPPDPLRLMREFVERC